MDAQSEQEFEAGDEEVPGATAWVEDFEFGSGLWPVFVGARGGSPWAGGCAFFIGFELLTHKAEVAEVTLAGGRMQRTAPAEFVLVLGGCGEVRVGGKHLASVPGAERVVEQEEDHVVLGEELGDGGERFAGDLLAGLDAGVDSFFLGGLPELVGPPEGVVGGEDFAGQVVENLLEFDADFGSHRHFKDGIARAEDLWQCLLSEAGGECLCFDPFLAGQILAFFHRDCDAGSRLDDQVVLGEEAGKEQAMPLFVGDFVCQPGDGLCALLFISHITKLAATGTELVAELALLRVHGGVRLMVRHSQGIERVVRSSLSSDAGRDDRLAQLVAKTGWKWRHGSSSLCTWSARTAT